MLGKTIASMGAGKSKSVVDKIAASRRQLDTAIWLWFNHGDIVSIHTLTDAAFGILLDLYHVRKWKQPIPFDDEGDPGGAEPKKWRKKVKEAGAFGKHARSDHDLTFEYNHIFMEAYLVCAVSAHSRLEKPPSDCLRFIYWLWFDLQYPHYVKPLQVTVESSKGEQLKKLSRTKFLQIFGPQFVGNPPKPDL
jgi:hypothetical protein